MACSERSARTPARADTSIWTQVWKVTSEDFPQSGVHDRMVAPGADHTFRSAGSKVLPAFAIV